MQATTPEVVRDEQHAQPEVALELGQQLEHRGLHRDVERRRHLVADQQVGLRRQRPRDRHALALAARELDREAVGDAPGQPHPVEQLAHLAVGVAAAEAAQHPQRPLDRRADAVPRVERLERVLEDDLDPPALVERSGGGRDPASSWPSNTIRPDVGSWRPAMHRPTVVLPLPDSPTRATQRPCGMLNETSSTRGAACRGGTGRQPRDLEQRVVGSRQRPRRGRPPAGARPASAPPSGRSAPRGRRSPARAPGTPAQQRSSWCSQRGAKAQPAGHSPTPTDTPGMPCSARGWRKSGIAATSARVYGCLGRSMTSAAGPFSTTRPAYMTTIRSAILRDHREVVRHVDHRHAVLVAQPRELRQDPVLGEHVEPGGRLVEHGDRRARRRRPSRSSPAAAGRRRAGADSARRSARRCPARRATSAALHRLVGGGRRPVRAQDVHDRVADPHRRVERAARILRHVGDDLAAHGAQRLARRGR